MITRNDISSRWLSVDLGEPDGPRFTNVNNLFYHNNFYSSVSIMAEYHVNFWDNGYPSGGNYWSGFNGTDLFSGPYQNETGGDGISDIPYIININNVDRYPLMMPYAIPSFPPEVVPSEASLSVNIMKNGIPTTSNILLLDENGTVIETVGHVSTYRWILPVRTYYVQAVIFNNNFAYTSEQIQVNLTGYTELAINFLFGNLTVSCFDIENRPLENCTVIFTREDEQRINYTDNLGLTTLEAYYGNWTVKAYWMGVLVGEANSQVNQSKMDLSFQCNVGDFAVIVVDQYGHFIEANVTLRNYANDLTFSGYIRKPMENITFTQIPLIDYNLTIKGDFGTQTYFINAEQTRQIQIETIPITQKIIYIILGMIAGIIIGSTGIWIATKGKRKQ